MRYYIICLNHDIVTLSLLQSSYEARRKKHLWRKKRYNLSCYVSSYMAVFVCMCREEILYKYKEFSYHSTAVSQSFHLCAQWY